MINWALQWVLFLSSFELFESFDILHFFVTESTLSISVPTVHIYKPLYVYLKSHAAFGILSICALCRLLDSMQEMPVHGKSSSEDVQHPDEKR